MERRERTELIQDRLEKLMGFLDGYLPLANLHNTDFITNDMWERCVPSKVRDDLNELSTEELAKLPSATLYQADHTSYNREQSDLHAKKHVDPDDKENRVYEFICVNPDKKGPAGRSKFDCSQRPKWRHSTLEEFMRDARHHTLPELGVLTSQQDFQQQWQSEEKLTVPDMMSAKKGHEVDIMAHACASMCQHLNLDKVIDIGSGRGYLSSQLSLLHNLQVLGIDSSSSNTHSAEDRSKKLEKHWAGLVRNAKEEKQQGRPIKRSKKEKLRRWREQQTKEAKEIWEGRDTKESQAGFDNTSEKTGTISLNQSDGQSESDVGPADAALEKENVVKLEKNSTKSQYVPITLFVTQETDLPGLLKEHFRPQVEEIAHLGNLDIEDKTGTKGIVRYYREQVESQETVINEACKPSGTDSHRCETALNEACKPPGTDSHRCETGINEECKPPGTDDHRWDFMLTGLHTCGDLATSMLRLYAHNVHARALCNVGCCYHLIEEEFCSNPFHNADEAEPVSTFPASAFLKSKGIRLGRNARMLAAQAPARMAQNGTLPHKSLHYRAVLQVILQDLTGTLRDDWQVGKIFAKCSSFVQYVRKALKKLNISDQLSDEAIMEYEAAHVGAEQDMIRFFQLRAVLAPCIEAFILLDRLLYLLEQECVGNAYLLQLFDPVMSPRCHAIISHKRVPTHTIHNHKL